MENNNTNEALLKTSNNDAGETEKLLEFADFEERKRKEDQLFKECLDSGYFTEYEEIEFPDPIEGVEEEPVCERSVVEERTTSISKQSVHVGFTHD